MEPLRPSCPEAPGSHFRKGVPQGASAGSGTREGPAAGAQAGSHLRRRVHGARPRCVSALALSIGGHGDTELPGPLDKQLISVRTGRVLLWDAEQRPGRFTSD